MQRELHRQGARVHIGAWEGGALPLPEGLHCAMCLEEGAESALDITPEELNLEGLGEAPAAWLPPQSVDLAELQAAIEGRFPGQVRLVEDRAAEGGKLADAAATAKLPDPLRAALHHPKNLGPEGRLYAFQAECLDWGQRGGDVIATTPTGSGKSWACWLPALSRWWEADQGMILYLSPLVALGQDQVDALCQLVMPEVDWGRVAAQQDASPRRLQLGGRDLWVARWDGNVGDAAKDQLRKRPPHVLMTTPDSLHAALLPAGRAGGYSASWWPRVHTVIVDELHTYRGVMGGHLANLIRRLRRLVEAGGGRLQVLAASATLTDPEATAERLLGTRPKWVDGAAGGPPRHPRRVLLVDTDRGPEGTFAITTVVKEALAECLQRRVPAISFSNSLGEVHDLLRYLQAEDGIAPHWVTMFERKMLPEDKQRALADLKQGRAGCVVASSALAMGIDVGALSVAVVGGFPGSIAQAWQMAGRAGRKGPGLVVYVAGLSAIDRHLARHPEDLLRLAPEPSACNPNHPELVRRHALVAASEWPLPKDPESLGWGPEAVAVLKACQAEGLLVPSEAGWVLPEGQEAPRFGLRALGQAVDLVLDGPSQERLAELDEVKARQDAHKHAVLTHFHRGKQRHYQILRLDLPRAGQKGRAVARLVEKPTHHTQGLVNHRVLDLAPKATGALGAAVWGQGRLTLRSTTDMYAIKPLGGGPAKFQPLGVAAPEAWERDTEGWWATWPADTLQLPALRSLAEALRQAAAMLVRFDVGDFVPLAQVEQQEALVGLADLHPGSGLCLALRDQVPALLELAWRRLADCPDCSQDPDAKGCLRCVAPPHAGEGEVDRQGAMALLGAWRQQQTQPGPGTCLGSA